MASKFGGIPEEEAKKQSQFGGVSGDNTSGARWRDLPSDIDWNKAGGSLPESAKNVGIALTAPIHSPIETAKGLGNFGIEALKKSIHSQMRSWFNLLYDHDIGDSDTAVDQMMDFYADRYGSPEGIKQAIEEDPASVIVDGLSVVYGAPSALKQVTKAAGKLTPAGTPQRMYESAAKLSTSPNLNRERIVQTLLDNRIPLSEKGVAKTASMIIELNRKIDDAIAAHDFGKAYPRNFPVRTLERLAENQIGKLGGGRDAKVIRKVLDDYIGDIDTMPNQTMSLQELQQWKKDAYKRINWRTPTEKQTSKNLAYKEAAGTARKDIERLTEGSDVSGMNRLEGNLIEALEPLERSVSRTRNNNLIGMDKTLSPAAGMGGALAFGIDPAWGLGLGALKSGLGSPALKSRMATFLHHAKKPGVEGRLNVDPAYTKLTQAMMAAYLNSPTNRQ